MDQIHGNPNICSGSHTHPSDSLYRQAVPRQRSQSRQGRLGRWRIPKSNPRVTRTFRVHMVGGPEPMWVFEYGAVRKTFSSGACLGDALFYMYGWYQ